ncbi:lipid IV(A) 3-deoxy-D-manno-octulosonic acid transferase [Vibrio algarum]|uniref:3-deoxy-D-manno-octulosonic acid transferase n=1 Tax=Vibrio algarum TaxID=3020714 RepID=A0ABT4YLQ4_9VIBR|nr:lipid IV(A) 3-deoxy-D-manno-octulosonic acid transferase [Vibrio sp. KJ40-1]MDB1122453.1 lipid IV(A) 3-deoxy-D-manno-octulosonic acid transferase [Vibrio sp. KJ40-1]
MFIRLCYTILLALAAPFLLFGLYKKKEGKPSVGHRWKEHFGVTPKLSMQSEPIWIHAVSVGEAIAATPLIKAIKQRHPEQSIVVTTTTPTGADQVAKLGELVEHRYMPIDFPFAIKGFLKALKPSQLLIMETELWPNTLHTVAKANIPITVMNARLSERSCQSYAKVQRVFDLLANELTHILCQHQDDAERFIRLGVERNKVSVTGSLKFDIEMDGSIIHSGASLREKLGKHRSIWIAASTHQGEDEQLISVHRKLLVTFPKALLVLVPRHPERFASVAKLCANQGFNTVLRTDEKASAESSQIYIGDTMGEMMTLIAASDICFMGGSLLGDKVGGHNLLEPAALGKPIVTGPSYYNFSDITKQLTLVNGAIVVAHEEALLSTLSDLFTNPKAVAKMGSAALKVVEQNRGALDKTLSAIL